MTDQPTESADGGAWPPVVLVGLCAHGLAIARTLGQMGVEVHALEKDRMLPGYATRYAQVHWVGDINGPRLAGALQRHARVFHSDVQPVLILTNDNMVREVARAWAALAPYYRMSWAGQREEVLRLLDKRHIDAVCRARGIEYPETTVIADVTEVEREADSLRYPVIIKPSRPLSAFKAFRIDSAGQFRDTMRRYPDELPVLAQKWITGDDTHLYFCALYLEAGRVRRTFVGRKGESLPRTTGQTVVAMGADHERVRALTESFFEGLFLSGPVSLEFKLDANGVAWVIEPTVGRTDYWLDCCVQSGVNLVAEEYRHVSGMATGPDRPARSAVWFDTERAPMAYIRAVFRNRSLRPFDGTPIFPYLGHGDRGPLLKALRRYVRRRLQRLGARLRGSGGGSDTELPGKFRAARSGVSVSVYDRIDQLPSEVAAAVAPADDSGLFLGREWFENFEDTVLPPGRAPRYLAFRKVDGGVPIVLPTWQMEPRWGGLGARWLQSMSNFYTSLYAPAGLHADGADEVDVEALVDGLCRMVCPSRMDAIDLHPLASDALFGRLKQAFERQGWYTQAYFCFGNWYQPCAGLSWNQYWEGRPGHLRNTIVRKQKRFDRLDNSTIEVIRGPDRVDQGMRAFRRVYARRWQRPEPYPYFLDGLADLGARRGWLRLGIAWVDGEPVAAQMWLVVNGVASIYKMAHDPAAREFSPGTLLTRHLMRCAIEQDRVTEVDYLTGDEPYKKDWMDCRRERWGIVAFNRHTWRGRAAATLHIGGSALKYRMNNWFGRHGSHEVERPHSGL